MNIAFYITPKSDIVTLSNEMTIRQAMEKMEFHKYTSVPVIDSQGRYVFTLSEGDILWHIKKENTLKGIETERITEIQRHWEFHPASINSNIESMIEVASRQSFIPVVDDQSIFIGIIRRSDIINYCINKLKINKDSNHKDRSA